ncbi:hypothetical protein KDW_17830 [Dictyobacter vulcani]|uniref:DUF5666 domain-containing protein n=1 Tax=Dictyobacter vulcani TaxID=2607529 RepID=A0A5J4KMV0_9CHLR|nr:hypothetical protein [Dictyobacter vulcani]GER87621.1 hypothetical protein KDW_17830 [Dictyobacter vulcani]
MKLWQGITVSVVTLITLGLAPMFTRSGQAKSPCTQQANYTGTIDSINKDYNTIKLYDPEQTEVDPIMGRVSLVAHTNKDTQVYRQKGDKCESASLHDLKPGLKLNIWTKDKVVVEMFPLPVRATTIVIID